MTEREEVLVKAALNSLKPIFQAVMERGWQAEVVVFGPEEMPRLPGYKVGIIIPVEQKPGTTEFVGCRNGSTEEGSGG